MCPTHSGAGETCDRCMDPTQVGLTSSYAYRQHMSGSYGARPRHGAKCHSEPRAVLLSDRINYRHPDSAGECPDFCQTCLH